MTHLPEAPRVFSSHDIVEAIKARIGAAHVRTGAGMEGYLEDFWGRAKGEALCVAFPGDVNEVAAILSFCNEARVAVFPQGGNTSTCLGAAPDSGGRSLVLRLDRMKRILSVDPVDGSLVAQAGCVLADIQKAASAAGRLFPLSLGAEGSCQIGGNVSTNAGGVSVLRYGNTRDLVLGLEVVLPDGRIWNGLRTLRKNNSGYDLKHLFIGAEGTLGVVTAVALKLYPGLPDLTAALIAFADAAHLAAITEPLRARFDSAIVAMELISGSELRIVRQFFPDMPFPFPETTPWFLLVDVALPDGEAVGAAMADVLSGAIEDGRVVDVVVSTSVAQRAALWRLRHSVTEAHKKYGMGMSHDVAVPIAHIPEFLRRAGGVVAERFPEADIAVVGHVGDGNLHYNVIYEMSRWRALADPAGTKKAVYKAIYDIAADLDGTFSAEHGVGALHLDEMRVYKALVELDMMRAVKTAFDPNGIMNPGRVLPE